MISFQNTSSFQISTTGTINQLAIADITGDSRGELLITAFTLPFENVSHSIKLYSPDTNGSFQDISASIQGGTPGSVHARQVVIADYNGDGIQDFYIAGHGYDVSPYPGEVNTLLISGAAGSVHNATSNLPQISSYTHSAAAIDIDLDGDIDLIDGNLSPAYNGPNIVLNNNNLFSSSNLLDSSQNNFNGGNTYSFLHSNSDNIPDLYFTNSALNGSNSIIFYGRGDGTFYQSGISAPALPSGYEEIDSQVIDLNGDGRDDVITSAYTTSFTGVYTRILIQQPDGTLVDETATRVPYNDLSSAYWRERVYFADLDHDGDMDAVVQYNGSGAGNTEIWENDGTGKFTSSTLQLPVQSFSRVAIGDIDGDHKTDIIAVQDTTAYVLTNTSTPDSPSTESIYRFFNPETGSHYFATGDGQRATIATTNPSWLNEGVAFHANTAQDSGTIPVARIYNHETGRYLFTADTTEIAIVKTQGWTEQESGVWFVTRSEDASLGYTTGVFRLYVPALQGHVYSSNEAEIDILISTLNATNEGAAYYLNSSLTPSAAASYEYGIDTSMNAETIAELVGLGTPSEEVTYG